MGDAAPFILIARCKINPNCVTEYIEAAQKVDDSVQNTEEGMLHHTFDQDPDDPYTFVWSEVYKDDESLMFHLQNPPLLEFVQKHQILGTHFSIEVYGSLEDDTKKALVDTGFPVKFFQTKLGFTRL